MEDGADWAALAALERRIDGVATEADEALLARASAGGGEQAAAEEEVQILSGEEDMEDVAQARYTEGQGDEEDLTITKKDRLVAKLVHKAHLLFALAKIAARSEWCDADALQRHLSSAVRKVCHPGKNYPSYTSILGDI